MNETAATNSLHQRIQEALALALQVTPETITADLSFGDIPQWDSMGHMEVMMRLEEFFGIEINAETIALLTSVESIRTYLENSHQEA
ncbi:MAG: acyl carrier protein [Anaerolineales bacterium]